MICPLLIACGSDDDNNDNGGTTENNTSFTQPPTTGWTDQGKTCYWVPEQKDNSMIAMQHDKFVFASSADDAVCTQAVKEILCTSAANATITQATYARLGATIKESRIVTWVMDGYIGQTKKAIRSTFVKEEETPDEPGTPRPELNKEFLTGKWIRIYLKQSLAGETTILSEEKFYNYRWELKADSTAVWSHRSWSDRWQMFDPWTESPDNYTWSFTDYGNNNNRLVLTKHEGKKGFGDYKETHTRRIITTWTDSTFSWKNPDGERMDGKAYEIYEQYKREK